MIFGCWQLRFTLSAPTYACVKEGCAGYKLTPGWNSSKAFHIRCGLYVLTIMAQSVMLGAVLDVRRATQAVWSGCSPSQSLHAKISTESVRLTRGGAANREITIQTAFTHGVTFRCTCKTSTNNYFDFKLTEWILSLTKKEQPQSHPFDLFTLFHIPTSILVIF